jgi:hypothetical protein
MLTPKQIDELAARIVGGYEEELITRLTSESWRALFRDGKLTAKDLQTLETLASSNRAALQRILAGSRARIDRQVRTEVEAILRASDDDDVAAFSRAYPGRAPIGSSVLFERMSEQTARGLSSIIARQNIAMASRLERAWYDIAAQAITEFNQGGLPLNRIMERAVRRLNTEGMQTIDYASGVKTSVDAAVRRHVVSQVAQAAGRMTLARMADYGHDLLYVPAHFGARPEHAAWHGKVYSMSGTTPGYPDFTSSTRYGSIEGILGVNCKHTFGPWFPGISRMPEQENERNGLTSDEYYDATQRQRAMERNVRLIKRDAALIEAGGGDPSATKLKLRGAQAKVRAHVKSKGLVRQPTREKAYGLAGR